jgi:predicted glycosyl hydrolase (DUF1957 family)
MTKEDELMGFLSDRVFDPILDSPKASKSLKLGVRMTIMRMRQRDAAGIVAYYWSAIIGTEKSTKFAEMMRAEGFSRFEEVLEEFRDRFDTRWVRS